MGLFTEIFKNPSKFENTPGGILSGTGPRKDAREAAQAQLEFQRETRGLFEPIVQAGIAQIPELASSATVEGFGSNIGDILNSGALNPLIQQRQRSADALVASRGLRRSGAAVQEAADIPADLALQIESELNRRRQSIAGQGQTGASNLGNVNTMMGQILGQNAATQAQIGQNTQQNALAIGGALLTAFSDPRLKENIEVIGSIDGLNVIEWDWSDLAFIKFGFKGSSVGFNAEEVREKRPDCAFIEDGLLKVDYAKVLKRVH